MNKFRLFLLPAFALGLYSAQAQVKVGDNPTNVNSSAIFEMESTNKGVLFPRMALTAANSPSPLSAFVAGMTVYNTATAGSGVNAITPGMYYSDGTKWMPIGKDWAEDQSLGSIAVFPFASVPSTYLICNGQAVSRTTYAALYAKIGTTYGAGDGSTTFNLPDLRGEFIRGWDNGRGVDSGRALGSTQVQGTARPTTAFTGTTSTDGAHTHTFITMDNGGVNDGSVAQSSSSSPNSVGTTSSAGSHTHTVSITGGGDSETRPRNVAMVYAIKAVESIIVSGSSGSGTTYNGSTSVTLNGTSFERAALTGDVTATANSNATTIAANAVTSAKIADGTIATADVADSAITSAKIADGTVATVDLADSSVTTAKIADGAVATVDIANNAVTVAKLPAGATVTSYLRGDGVWATPTDTYTIYSGSTSVTLNGTSFERAALTGDVTATANSNATTIAANAVTSAKIADGTIVTADVADAAITAAKINQMSAIAGQALVWNGTAWTPTSMYKWSSPVAMGMATTGGALSSGTVIKNQVRYRKTIDDTEVFWELSLGANSVGSSAGSYLFTLPTGVTFNLSRYPAYTGKTAANSTFTITEWEQLISSSVIPVDGGFVQYNISSTAWDTRNIYVVPYSTTQFRLLTLTAGSPVFITTQYWDFQFGAKPILSAKFTTGNP